MKKLKTLYSLSFLSLIPSFAFLNSCQQNKNDDVDDDAKEMKKNLVTLMKELNVKTFKELRELLVKYKENGIKISNDLLKVLGVKDLDAAIIVVNNLIVRQNNSKKAHALSCFMFGTNGIIPYVELLNKFDDETWKNEYTNEIMMLCEKLGIEISELNANLQINKEIIALAEEYAKDMFPAFQKMVQKEKNTFISEFKTQNEKENKQILLLSQFLLEKEANEFTDELKKQFDQEWKQNHSNEVCAAFGVEDINSFGWAMISETVTEKAQEYAKKLHTSYATTLSAKLEEFKTQNEKENKQIWLLSQFLLEKEANEFTDELKKQFDQEWKQNHSNEVCAAFGVENINSFDGAMISETVTEKAQEYAKKLHTSCEKILQEKIKEFTNRELHILEQFENDFENLPEDKQKILFEIIHSLLDIALTREDPRKNYNNKFLIKLNDLINTFIKESKNYESEIVEKGIKSIMREISNEISNND